MTHDIIAAQAATSNITSAALDVNGVPVKVNNIGMQVVATALSSADSVVKLQHSNDGTNFADITDASLTLAAGASTPVLSPIAMIGMRYYRAVYTKNTNAAGTVKVIINVN